MIESKKSVKGSIDLFAEDANYLQVVILKCASCFDNSVAKIEVIVLKVALSSSADSEDSVVLLVDSQAMQIIYHG